MNIKPDKKLIVKQWLTLATVSLVILAAGILLQLLVPLSDEVEPGEVSIIVWPIVVLLIILMWVISAPLVMLWIKNLSYFIEEDRITINKGILSKIQQNIPLRGITDFMLHRSLYDRILGIGSIRIQTAGQSRSSNGYEGQLSGLLNWEGLHQQMREKLKSLHPESASLTVAEKGTTVTGGDRLELILEELRAIRRVLEDRR